MDGAPADDNVRVLKHITALMQEQIARRYPTIYFADHLLELQLSAIAISCFSSDCTTSPTVPCNNNIVPGFAAPRLSSEALLAISCADLQLCKGTAL